MEIQNHDKIYYNTTLKCLYDKVTHDPAIIRVHSRAKCVEDTGNANINLEYSQVNDLFEFEILNFKCSMIKRNKSPYLALFLVCIHHCFRNSFALNNFREKPLSKHSRNE